MLPTALNDSEIRSSPQSICPTKYKFDGAVDDDPEIRDSINEDRECAKKYNDSFTNKSNHCGTKQARAAVTTTSRKHAAQMAGSESDRRKLAEKILPLRKRMLGTPLERKTLCQDSLCLMP